MGKDHLVLGLLSGVGDVELLRASGRGARGEHEEGDTKAPKALPAPLPLMADAPLDMSTASWSASSTTVLAPRKRRVQGLPADSAMYSASAALKAASASTCTWVHTVSGPGWTASDDLISSDQGGAHGVRRYGRVPMYSVTSFSANGHGPMGTIREDSRIGHFAVRSMLCSCEKASTQPSKHACASYSPR